MRVHTYHLLFIGLVLLAAMPPSAHSEDDVLEVLTLVNQQLQTNPNDPKLLIQRAKLYEVQKRYDQALADLEQANRAQPQPNIDLEKARIYLSAGWYETGIEHATKQLARTPDDPNAFLVRARLKAGVQQVAGAHQDYQAALDKMPEPPMELFIEHAQALNSPDGEFVGEAVKTLDKAIGRYGSIVTLESAAMELELQQRQYDAALKRTDRLKEKMPRKDTWLAKRGDILAEAGRSEEAKQAYKDALAAIEKLSPGQRNQSATKNLEAQIRKTLATVGDLRTNAPVAGRTQLLARRTNSPMAELVPAFTNEPALPADGKLRTYYMAAEETEWDYAPNGNVLQEPFCGDPDAMPGAAPGRIGNRYRKMIYREYTDANFNKLQPRIGHWRHLGMLGPLIRAEVGDRIKIYLRNKTRYPVSLHPHGVFYLKTSEGSGYNDSTVPAEKKDDAVMPGEMLTYDWLVPERAGPGPSDPSSIVWLYHSHVHAPMDGNAGLIGAMIVCARGKARPDLTPTDVDREFVTLFNIYDENQSHLFEANVVKYLGSTNGVPFNDLRFIESNMKHTINGYIFANLPLMTMQQGERVRWYLLGMGNEVDLHTAHWHGNTVLCRGYRTDVVELLPASMKVADMVADNVGIWMYHCHVNDHMLEGMSARYQVQPQVVTRTASKP